MIDTYNVMIHREYALHPMNILYFVSIIPVIIYPDNYITLCATPAIHDGT